MHDHAAFITALLTLAQEQGVHAEPDDMEEAWDKVSLNTTLTAPDALINPDTLWGHLEGALRDVEDTRQLQEVGGDAFYLCDCHTLADIAKNIGGTDITLAQAYTAWSAYSNTLAAGWLVFPSTREAVWEALSPHLAP